VVAKAWEFEVVFEQRRVEFAASNSTLDRACLVARIKALDSVEWAEVEHLR
jgi:hypothetical protein